MNQQERQALVSYFEKEYFALENGMRLTRVEPGRACGEMEAGKRHLNANGVVMGGALFTLGDLVLAAAANSHGTLAVSTDCDIRFLRPAPGRGQGTEEGAPAGSVYGGHHRWSRCALRPDDRIGAPGGHSGARLAQ